MLFALRVVLFSNYIFLLLTQGGTIVDTPKAIVNTEEDGCTSTTDFHAATTPLLEALLWLLRWHILIDSVRVIHHHHRLRLLG